MRNEEILIQYDSFRKLADEFSLSVKALVSALIQSTGITPHSISCRVKKKKDLAKKIENKEKYKDLAEITDIIGLRVISLYSDEVDKIAEIIESEFKIDIDNSIDKRAVLDPDRFGYLSLHYVVSLDKRRDSLKEYEKFQNIKFEIQIRSILQHTWAEIEHDTGYKSKIEIPRNIRRQFSRLAGLLELADIEFGSIRNELLSYEKEVESGIELSPETIEIDIVSILKFLNKNDDVKSLDIKVMKIANISHLKEAENTLASYDVKFAEFFNIKTIADLSRLLVENKDNILLRASDADAKGDFRYNGISVFYLSHVLAAKLKTDESRIKFINHVDLGGVNGDFEKYLNELSKKIT